MKRIGLLGGTFNPIHCGHLAMAEAALCALSPGEIVIMPDGDPPHKEPQGASAVDRLEMARLAAAGRFAVSSMEVERPGITYTIDTLEALRAQGVEEIYMIIGADTLGELTGWKNPGRVFSLCRFLALGREGCRGPDAPQGARVTRIEAEIPGVSSTQVRARVQAGLALTGLVPVQVEAYIGRKRLYNPPPLLTHAQMLEKLQAALPAKRYRHVLGVVETAVRLAKHYGYDPARAELAALLHDCAKGMALEEMRACAAKYEVDYDAMRGASTALLHAPVGAAVARAEYGVTDPDVLHAICYHNTGCDGMGALDAILYLADMTEPSRRPYEGLDALRAKSEQGLTAALAFAMAHKLRYIRSTGEAHPDTERAYAWLQARIAGGKGIEESFLSYLEGA